MLNRCPTYLPPLSTILDDIGNPSLHQVAKALGVSFDQVSTWRDLDEAPRPVCLALYWLTRWGQSSVDCEAVNAARLHVGVTRALQTQLDQVRRELARVVALGDFGCANAPTLQAPLMPSLRMVRQ